MNETDIRRYAELMRELELTGLEITEGDRIVRLERTNSAPAGTAAAPVSPSVPGSAAPENGGDYTSVKSPLVGVFYAAPAENAAPYVAVGDRVRKGQILCIIEAMKLMNELTADQDGEVVDICVNNGDVVEYGQPLFKLC